MNKIILFVFVSVLFFSCKKEKPEEPISYTHWYKIRNGSTDTLFSVYIPNTFSPNGDGNNDIFRPFGQYDLHNFKILNKNNNQIFETTNKNSGWDGKNHASADFVPIGNYIYKLIITDDVDAPYEYVGMVTLFK
ncbi:MAG: gliding motility-associated C-terminal domain-containing protein [Bacteroidia bacterium]|nr:gliding motility-associated C-terminal domain-containing protein [Bacteroidia bacterium]